MGQDQSANVCHERVESLLNDQAIHIHEVIA
jgi:hypothetical protein